MDNTLQKKQVELEALHTLFDDYGKIMDLNRNINAEEERIKEMEKNVNSTSITPPKSNAKKVQQELLKPKKTKVSIMEWNVFRIYAILCIGIILISGYMIFRAISVMSYEHLLDCSFASDILDWGSFSAFIFIPIFELPIIIISFIFCNLILD